MNIHGEGKNRIDQDYPYLRLLCTIVSFYFLFTALRGLFGMIEFRLPDLCIFIILSVYVISYDSIRNNISLIGISILFTALIISAVGIVIEYPWNLYWSGLSWEIFPMLFFFVGCNKHMANNDIFERGILIVFLVSLIGLWLFLTLPSWYVSFRMENQTNYSQNSILEMTRLSAFWDYPYWVSYGTAIIYFYLLCKYCYLEQVSLKMKVLSLFFLSILLLTQQRAPIGFSFLTTFAVFVYSCYNKKLKKVRFFLIQLFVVILLLFIIASFIISEELIEFMTKKVTILFDDSTDSSFIEYRAQIFSDFSDKTVSLWGDGIGRYSHLALLTGGKGISDQQYLKMLYETGYFGFCSRLLIIGIILLKGISNFRNYFFEVGIIIMFLISMFGANSLAVREMHCWIFWLCCGRIYNKKKIVWVNCKR